MENSSKKIWSIIATILIPSIALTFDNSSGHMSRLAVVYIGGISMLATMILTIIFYIMEVVKKKQNLVLTTINRTRLIIQTVSLFIYPIMASADKGLQRYFIPVQIFLVGPVIGWTCYFIQKKKFSNFSS